MVTEVTQGVASEVWEPPKNFVTDFPISGGSTPDQFSLPPVGTTRKLAKLGTFGSKPLGGINSKAWIQIIPAIKSTASKRSSFLQTSRVSSKEKTLTGGNKSTSEQKLQKN